MFPYLEALLDIGAKIDHTLDFKVREVGCQEPIVELDVHLVFEFRDQAVAPSVF
jgi:hypothetical protein